MSFHQLPLLDNDPPTDKASRLLPQSHFDYFYGSAGDERTYSDNLSAFRRVYFVPRMFVPVSTISTCTTISLLGRIPLPILIAPMAMQRLAHPHGELAVARAANAAPVPMVVSTFSTTSLEQIASVPGTYLLQLYLSKRRNVSLELIRRAHKLGFKAVVLTVDAPHYGRRERDRNNKFKLPDHMELGNFTEKMKHSSTGSGLDFLSDFLERDLTIDALQWLVNASPLPVWVKGILHPADAEKAISVGVQGIVVSNHGGRQLEGTIPTLAALPPIAQVVKGRVPVLLDSGVRTGEDVARALALGADAILLGRPVLWALADKGEEGVRELLRNVIGGLKLCMALLGARKVEEITREMVIFRTEAKL